MRPSCALGGAYGTADYTTIDGAAAGSSRCRSRARTWSDGADRRCPQIFRYAVVGDRCEYSPPLLTLAPQTYMGPEMRLCEYLHIVIFSCSWSVWGNSGSGLRNSFMCNNKRFNLINLRMSILVCWSLNHLTSEIDRKC